MSPGTQRRAGRSSVSARTPVAARGRWPLRPVTMWAAVGVLSLVGGTWSVGRWLLDSRFKVYVPWPGEGGISDARYITLWVFQGLIMLAAIGLVGYVVRQCLAERKFTFDASLVVAYAASFWLEPLTNVSRPSLVLNVGLIRVSTWGPYIPGWYSQDAEQQTHAVVTSGPWGYAMTTVWPLLAAAVMGRTVLRRWPNLRGGRFVLAALGCSVLIDWTLEWIYILTGTVTFPGTEPVWLTPFMRPLVSVRDAALDRLALLVTHPFPHPPLLPHRRTGFDDPARQRPAAAPSRSGDADPGTHRCGGGRLPGVRGEPRPLHPVLRPAPAGLPSFSFR